MSQLIGPRSALNIISMTSSRFHSSRCSGKNLFDQYMYPIVPMKYHAIPSKIPSANIRH